MNGVGRGSASGDYHLSSRLSTASEQFGLYNWVVMEANLKTIEGTLLKALQ
jgi:hypothetical protein